MRSQKTGLNIEMVGINRATSASANFLAVFGRTLPWLQDTNTAANVWTNWNVIYRDVWVLDGRGQKFAVFNLTDNNLADESNRERLAEYFLQAAKVADADNDKLPDVWEENWFGNLNESGSGDGDRDGYDNASEFAFGSSPVAAGQIPVVSLRTENTGAERRLVFSTRRPLGGFLRHFLDSSSDLKSWLLDASGSIPQTESRNLFDSSGTGSFEFALPISAAGDARGFVRFRNFPAPPN